MYQPTDVKSSKNAIIILQSNNSYNDSNYLAWLLREADVEISANEMFKEKMGTSADVWAAPPPPYQTPHAFPFLKQIRIATCSALNVRTLFSL